MLKDPSAVCSLCVCVLHGQHPQVWRTTLSMPRAPSHRHDMQWASSLCQHPVT